jgi:hypothetical protein
MKRFLLIAAVVLTLGLGGVAANTANAAGPYGYSGSGYGYGGGGYGHHHHHNHWQAYRPVVPVYRPVVPVYPAYPVYPGYGYGYGGGGISIGGPRGGISIGW